MSKHSKEGKKFLSDKSKASWHDDTLWGVRKKRDRAVNMIDDWEVLRERASSVKERVLDNLEEYILQFENSARNNGVIVHRTKNGSELNSIILNLLKSRGFTRVVKSKSMLTEECSLNHFLEYNGIEVVDTDLGERIIQFRGESPSHIVLPAIHLKREEIGETFHNRIGTPAGCSDPIQLTAAARVHLRSKFLNAQAAITGVNFAVAESGTVVICTNEGNADMGLNASAKLHIHCMGMEKIVPTFGDLAIFTRLLARNATGQAITTYTSHYTLPDEDCEMHIVILDNGRSERLRNPIFRNSLKCIRCGACMNTCPVYRRSGGHSYRYLIPGPIGSIIAPFGNCQNVSKKSQNNQNERIYSDLPFASSLCGSCSSVCPVKIDIHNQLYQWRQILTRKKQVSPIKRVVMKFVGKILASHLLYSYAGKIARLAIRISSRVLIYNRLNAWGLERELPVPPKESFNEWFRRTQKS